jgi:N-acetyl-D-muramate 6-phosphate phosphatase
MLDGSRVHAILFDLDGTLSDTDDVYVERLSCWLAPLAFLFPQCDLRRPVRRLMMASEGFVNFALTVPDRLGIDEPLAGMVDAIARFRGLGLPGGFRIIPGVAEMLLRLKERYPLAIVSSRDRRGTEAFLSEFALADNFRAVITSLTAPRIKPHPAPVRMAAAKLGVPAEQCLMIGDTRVDILAGRRAGAQTAGVLCGFGSRAELRQAGADAILERTPDILNLLSMERRTACVTPQPNRAEYLSCDWKTATSCMNRSRGWRRQRGSAPRR